ncbi:MAG: diguanylate cyclase [Burkholderiales bacterium]|nr:diguanylate cyclase [Burkholderiales bacterium]
MSDLEALRTAVEEGRITDAERECRERLASAGVSEGALRARLLILLAHALNAQGKAMESLRHAREALDLARKAEAGDVETDALLMLGTALQGLDAHAEAFEALQEAERRTEVDGLPRARVLRRLGIGCSVVGRHAEAHELLQRAAVMMAEHGARPSDLWHARFSVLNARGRELDGRTQRGEDCRPDYAVLRQQWQEFLDGVRPTGLNRLTQMGMGNIGIAAQRAGDIEGALDWLKRARDLHAERGMRSHQAVTENHIGDCLFRLGRVEEAISAVEAGMALLEGGSPRELLEALEAIAPMYERAGDIARALDAYKRIRRIEKELADDDARRIADRRRQAQEIAALIADWSRVADEDALTGLANRRAFDRMFQLLCTGPKGTQQGGGLILADLDLFKRVNDTYGHAVGDAVLSNVGRLMRHVARKNDLAARVGGEELAIVVQDASPDALHDLAERLRSAVAAHDWSKVAPDLAVTLSAGTASLSELAEPDAAALYALADRRLYVAKHTGRNRVVSHDP